MRLIKYADFQVDLIQQKTFPALLAFLDLNLHKKNVNFKPDKARICYISDLLLSWFCWTSALLKSLKEVVY